MPRGPGHESFAAAEGAIGIARSANRVRETPLRVILNGLGKDAAIIGMGNNPMVGASVSVAVALEQAAG